MNGTILIADDDLGLAEGISRRCNSIGLNTIIVDNAESVLLAASCEYPDLAILDINMPSADGSDMLDLLATEPELSDLPIIILTGRTDRRTIEKCHNLHVTYIAKKKGLWPRLHRAIRDCLPSLPDHSPHSPGQNHATLAELQY
jgi:CheY-like chemotaxis protein